MTFSSLPDWVLRQLTPGETTTLRALPEKASTGKPMIEWDSVHACLNVWLKRLDERRDGFVDWHKDSKGIWIEFWRQKRASVRTPVYQCLPSPITRLRKKRKQQRGR